MTGKEISRRSPRAAVAVPDPSSLQGWAAELESAAGIARSLATTSFIPDSLKVWQGDPRQGAPLDREVTTAQVAAALLAGRELGLDPMASLRSISVIRGTPALSAMSLRAMLLHHGHDIAVVESTSTRAMVRGRRDGAGEPQTSTWTLDRAKLAGLYPGKPEGNWRRQPQAMLVARATAECARWIAADAILGMPYILEEIEDPDAAADMPADTEPEVKPKRRARRKTARPLPELPSGPPAIPQQRAGEHDQDPGPEPEPEPESVTKPQLTKLHVVLKSCGITDPAAGRKAVSDIAGRPLDSSTELTKAEASRVIDELEALAESVGQADPRDDDAEGGEDGC